MTSGPPRDSLPEIVRSLLGDSPQIAVPEGWLQGRTAFGGFSSAVALAAILKRWSDLPTLRSAQIAFIGPVANTARVETEVLRQGQSSTFAEASVFSGGKLALRALFLFSKPRASRIAIHSRAEQEGAAPLMGEVIERAPIALANNFECRSAGEERTGTGQYRRWVKLLERKGLSPSVELISVADMMPPAAMQLYPTPGPISSMTWQLDLLSDRLETREGWWLLHSTAEHAQDGISTQRMSVRNSEGQLLATGVQSVALFQ